MRFVFFVFLLCFNFFLNGENFLKKSIEIILKRDIFKPLPLKEEIKPEINVPVQQIQPNENIDKFFNLVGTIVFEEKEKNIAIVEDIKSKEIIFLHQNDKIKDFKIIEINREGIVYQTPFEEKYLLTPSGVKQLYFLPPTFYFRINLKNFIEQLKEDIEQLNLLKANFVSFDKNSGFKIEGIKQGGILEKAGIYNNDIILKINDRKIESPEECLSIYGDLLKTGRSKVKIEILRENRLLNLVFFLE